MRVAYSFSVLRYIHDAETQEFVNIGVALLSPDAQYLRALCTTRYGRITKAFEKIDGDRFRQLTRYIQDEIGAAGRNLPSSLPFEPGQSLEALLARVLPPDDSAIQFSPAGVGLSADLDKTLDELFHRYVERYANLRGESRRDDEDIWHVFRQPLDRAHVTTHLKPKRIVAPSYEYEFQRAWQNEIWHVYEPVSFDLLEAGSMLDKAHRWVGRANSLLDSPEQFQMNLLLGEPQDERLRPTFEKVQNILHKIPGRKEFIRETEAQPFAEELARELRIHDRGDVVE